HQWIAGGECAPNSSASLRANKISHASFLSVCAIGAVYFPSRLPNQRMLVAYAFGPSSGTHPSCRFRCAGRRLVTLHKTFSSSSLTEPQRPHSTYAGGRAPCCDVTSAAMPRATTTSILWLFISLAIRQPRLVSFATAREKANRISASG